MFNSLKLYLGSWAFSMMYIFIFLVFQGQFNFVEIVIKPLDNESNVITVSVKDELKDILTDTNRGPRVVSDKNLATLVRHIALHVNVSDFCFSFDKMSHCCVTCLKDPSILCIIKCNKR